MSSSLTPSEQLSLSRARLRLALHDTAATPGHTPGQRAGGSAAPWQENLKAIPGVGIALDALLAWWAGHPLRLVTLLAVDATKTAVRPIAQRHPVGLVLGSFLVGGLLAWSRPWRLILTPALLAGLLPQLLSKAATRLPARSWIEVLAALTQAPSAPPSAAQPAATSTPPTQPSRP